MKYCYDLKQNEFVPVYNNDPEPNGNRVTVEGSHPNIRFKIEIDDFGHVVAALNRLMLEFIPDFKYPTPEEIEKAKAKTSIDLIPKGTAYRVDGGVVLYFCEDKWGDATEPHNWSSDKIFDAHPDTKLPMNHNGDSLSGDFV